MNLGEGTVSARDSKLEPGVPCKNVRLAFILALNRVCILNSCGAAHVLGPSFHIAQAFSTNAGLLETFDDNLSIPVQICHGLYIPRLKICMLVYLPEFVYTICIQVPWEAGSPGTRVVRDCEQGTEPRSSARAVSALPFQICVLVSLCLHFSWY